MEEDSPDLKNYQNVQTAGNDYDEQIRKLEEQLEQLKSLRNKQNVALPMTPAPNEHLPRDQNLTEKEAINVVPTQKIQFSTYQKKRKANLGKKYQHLICVLHALKLSTCEKVKDFKITTNRKDYGTFDNIVLNIEFCNCQKHTFVLKLKYKQRRKRLTTATFSSNGRQNSFAIKRWKNFFKSVNYDGVSFLLYTNNRSNLDDVEVFNVTANGKDESCNQGDTSLLKVSVKRPKTPPYMDLLINTDGKYFNQPSIFQFSFEETEECPQDLFANFYLACNQINITGTKIMIADILNTILDKNILDRFVFYTENELLHTGILSKHYVVSTLVELTLSPWIRTISAKNNSQRTHELLTILLQFDIVLIDTLSEGTICFSKDSEDLWKCSDSIPYVVQVTDGNEALINRVLQLLTRNFERTKLILVECPKQFNFVSCKVFQNLSNLSDEDLDRVANSLYVSLQGKRRIVLKKIINSEEIVKSIYTSVLLEMAKVDTFVIGEKEKLPYPYISRTFSTLFLDINNILELNFCSDFLIVLQCSESAAFKLKSENRTVIFQNVEGCRGPLLTDMYSYIYLLIDNKWTSDDFENFCTRSRMGNVHLLQMLDANIYVVVFSKGDQSELQRFRVPRPAITAEETEKYLNNPLNVLCAPAGMGKSVEVQALNCRCSPDLWSVRVNLIAHNRFLKSKPQDDIILHRFFEMEKNDKCDLEIKNAFLKTKKICLFLDGLDEIENECIDHILSFAKRKSKDFKIWITTREHLKDTVITKLNVVPIEIQDISREEQYRQFKHLMFEKFSNKEIDKLFYVVFQNLPQYIHLLGNPFHIYSVARKFCYDSELVDEVNNNNRLLLTTLIQILLQGYNQLLSTKISKEAKRTISKLIDASYYFEQYEVLALKSCLSIEDYNELKIQEDAVRDFLENLQKEGDRLGIIKTIYMDQVNFCYQEFAAYFASSWIIKNLKISGHLITESFFRRNSCLRPLLDIMLASNKPLHLAIVCDNIQLVKKHSHQSNEKDDIGRFALHLACAYGNYEAVKILCQVKVEKVKQLLSHILRGINIPDTRGRMPIHYACGNSQNSYNIVQLLLGNGANINASDSDKRLPIHYACQMSDVRTVMLLLDNGAQLNVPDCNSRLPVDYANDYRSGDKIRKLLMKEGAKLPDVKVVIAPVRSKPMGHSSEKEEITKAEDEIRKRKDQLETKTKQRPTKIPVHKESNPSLVKTFRTRSGTADQEKRYEEVVLTKIVMQMVNDDKVKQFNISSNDENFGAFDDVVIEIETDRGIETKAIMLKHSNERNLPIERLASKKGDFSILEYFNSFQQLQNKAQQFILFTNLKFNISDNTKFQPEGENFYIKPVKSYISNNELKISHDIDYSYKFEILADNWTEETLSKVQQYKIFFKHFYLYSNQENIETLHESTKNKFIKMFTSDEETFLKYFKVISNWSMRQGKKNKLNKKWMQRTIALSLFSRQIVPYNFGLVNHKIKLFREAIELFDITLLKMTDCELVKQLWGDFNNENIDFNEMNQLMEDYRLPSIYIQNIKNLDPNILTQLLWLMNKCPLIVIKYENIDKAIQLCPEHKFVLLGEEKCREWMKKYSVFQNIFDLKSKQVHLYEEIIKTFTISLQGKKEQSLVTAFGKKEELLKCVTTNDLLDMLNGPRYIDGKKETLPTPYIERSLSQNIIDINYLDKVNSNAIIILNCEDNFEGVKKLTKFKLTNIDDFLYNFKSTTADTRTFIVSKNKCSQTEFQKICSKVSKKSVVHYFKVLNSESLEWVRSRGDVRELHNYKLSNHSKIENELWSLDFSKSINLIIGAPGVGKTVLTQSFKNNCSSKYWTAIITPEEINSLFENLKICKSSDYINLFQTLILNEKYHSLEGLDKTFFKMCLEQNRVIYVWDGLDEILAKHLDSVSFLILALSEKGFIQLVTSTQHLRSFLEKTLNILSMTINQFTEREKEDYVRQRFTSFISPDDMEKAIEKIKSTFVFMKHIDILGIPLQMFMLTEIIRKNNKKYLELLNNSFLLTDLYYYFIEEKFNTVYQIKLDVDIQVPHSSSLIKEKQMMLTCYERLAHRAVFPDEEIIKGLKKSFQKDVEHISGNYLSVGLIKGLQNNIPQFLHASFGEYLVAVYFSKNLEVIPRDIFFDQKYNNIRLFFDMLVAKESPAHISVLHRNFDELKNYDDEILARKDDGARSALHLICSWGQRRPRLEVTTFNEKRNFIHSLYIKMFFFKRKPVSKKYILEVDKRFNEELETKDYLDAVLHLCNKCDVSEQDSLLKMTPLEYARDSESLGVELKLLQSEKLQIEDQYTNYDRINILYYSALLGYDEVIKLFMIKNVNIHRDEANFITSNDCRTALIIASERGFQRVLEYLLKFGAEINGSDSNGWTPLYAASANGHEKVVEYLVKSGADINRADEDGFTPLYVASQNGHVKNVEYLVKAGAEVDRATNDGRTPLFTASFNGHETIVKYLVKAGAEFDRATNDGRTPLFTSSFNGHETIVEYLVKVGVEVDRADNDGLTPLYVASQKGHKQVVEYLVKSGADINRADEDGFTPLHVASQNGHVRNVVYLVILGAEVDRATNDGRTSLFTASFNGHETIVKYLVIAGAEVDRATNDGFTPLYVASQKGHEKVVEYLVKSGADINRADEDGFTPLYVASQNGHVKNVEYLVKAGAEVDRATNDGRTPLYTASFNGHETIVEYLVKAGAEIDRAHKSGFTRFTYNKKKY